MDCVTVRVPSTPHKHTTSLLSLFYMDRKRKQWTLKVSSKSKHVSRRISETYITETGDYAKKVKTGRVTCVRLFVSSEEVFDVSEVSGLNGV